MGLLDCNVCEKEVKPYNSAVHLEAEVMKQAVLVFLSSPRHIRCSPSRAQYIVHPQFQPPVIDNRAQFDKLLLAPEERQRIETAVTNAWLVLTGQDKRSEECGYCEGMHAKVDDPEGFECDEALELICIGCGCCHCPSLATDADCDGDHNCLTADCLCYPQAEAASERAWCEKYRNATPEEKKAMMRSRYPDDYRMVPFE